MKKIQDVLDEVDLDLEALPAPTQKRVQTYALLEKQLISAKLELEALEEPDVEKHEQYEDSVNYFNDYEEDVIQSIRAYAVRLEQELQAKAMKERRDAELKEKQNQEKIRARREQEEKERNSQNKAKAEAEERARKSKAQMESAQAKADEEARKAKEEAEENARKEEELNKPKKKSGGLGWLLAGLGIVAAVVTLGATKDK